MVLPEKWTSREWWLFCSWILRTGQPMSVAWNQTTAALTVTPHNKRLASQGITWTESHYCMPEIDLKTQTPDRIIMNAMGRTWFLSMLRILNFNRQTVCFLSGMSTNRERRNEHEQRVHLFPREKNTGRQPGRHVYSFRNERQALVWRACLFFQE